MKVVNFNNGGNDGGKGGSVGKEPAGQLLG